MKPKTEILVCGQDPSMRNWGIARGVYSITTGLITMNFVDVIQPRFAKAKGIKPYSLDILTGKSLFSAAHMHSTSTDITFAEVPVGSQSSRAACSYGMCTALLGALELFGVRLVQVTPGHVKQVSVGFSTATKEEMIAWAVDKHPEANWPMHGKHINAGKAEHMADAVAAIYAGIQKPEFINFLNERKL